jgi:outer membrane PBP1 activator LpoA protein
LSFNRYIWFSLSILFGLLIGLISGSRLIPIPYENLSFNSLRADYKTDYVLMAAEVYHGDHNIQQAQNLLRQLGPEAPIYQVQQAIVKGRDFNYSQQDMEWLIQLLQGLQTASQSPAEGKAP